MNLNFYTLCVIYLVYSFLGWVGETVVATAKGRRFTNRGVASGPFCFVYGTAGVLITIGLNDQRASLAALFFGSMIYATVVEWLTAKLLEMGVRFIGYSCDTAIFMNGAKADVEAFHSKG